MHGTITQHEKDWYIAILYIGARAIVGYGTTRTKAMEDCGKQITSFENIH
jgi:hypothetical protein